MGGEWYCRANREALFEIPKPLLTKGIGIDQLPEEIRNSLVLTGNNLGRLANVDQLPKKQEIEAYQNENIQALRAQSKPESYLIEKHKLAQKYLEQGKIQEAWLILLAKLD